MGWGGATSGLGWQVAIPESELLLRVQNRINDGQLPVTLPGSISAGYGDGAAVCQVCDQQILQDKVMYEVSDPRNSNRLNFHFACYAVWQRECAQRIAAEKKVQRDNVPSVPGQVSSEEAAAKDPMRN